jgi:flagella basal body P-ring formation protein FlgA
MNRFFLLSLLILVLLLPQFVAANTCEIELLSHGVSDGDIVRLENIATITPANPELAKLLICWGPISRMSRKVSKLNVAEKLRERFDIPLLLHGASFCHVSRSDDKSLLTPEKIRQICVEKLLEERPDLEKFSGKIHVEFNEKRIPAGQYKRVQVTFTNPKGNHPCGYLEVDFGEMFIKRLSFRMQGKIPHRVIKTARNITKGEILDQSDVVEEWIEGGLQSDESTQVTLKIYKEAANNIREGTILTDKHLVKHFDVKQGSNLFLVSNNSRIVIEVPVTALDNASIGDLIQVRNKISEKKMTAMLISNEICHPVGGK